MVCQVDIIYSWVDRSFYERIIRQGTSEGTNSLISPRLMRIKESKNLKYDNRPKVMDSPGDYELLDLLPRVCVLESFEKQEEMITLYFKNKSKAVIKATSVEGIAEIDLIFNKLNGLIGSSYEDILETEIE